MFKEPDGHAAQMKPPWPVNPIAGHEVPPDVDWLIGHLVKSKSTNRPNEGVVNHASVISSFLLYLVVR